MHKRPTAQGQDFHKIIFRFVFIKSCHVPPENLEYMTLVAWIILWHFCLFFQIFGAGRYSLLWYGRVRVVYFLAWLECHTALEQCQESKLIFNFDKLSLGCSSLSLGSMQSAKY